MSQQERFVSERADRVQAKGGTRDDGHTSGRKHRRVRPGRGPGKHGQDEQHFHGRHEPGHAGGPQREPP
eukprot:2285179-Pyramimonas_sp.AAC.1